jgi:hypothetical protein
VAGQSQRQARILRFWRALELFAAQPVDPVDEARQRFRVQRGRPLPWQDGHTLRNRSAGKDSAGKDRVWRHTVYAGIYALDWAHAILETVFGSSGEDFDERVPRGESALFALVVTDDGRPLLDSVLVSTAPWAVGRALDPGPDRADWLDGFDATAGGFGAEVREAVAAGDDDKVAARLREQGILVGRPLHVGDLMWMVELAGELLGVAEALRPGEIRVHSVAVSRRKAMDEQSDFLNSFYAEDLRRVADAVAAGDAGRAITTYLTDDQHLNGQDRVDLRRQIGFVGDRVAPQCTPAGRWPAKVTHPLALSQQFAVNEIMGRLRGDGGVFGVNGPPGTGKTTMLRDLVAAIVVERARRLAELQRPAAGFGKADTWKTETGTRRGTGLASPLAGFEIVVASTNNGAVANVTREIPQRGAIDAEWVQQADYFAEHASRILDAPAWGLVAAMLGNQANRNEFVSRFWFGDQPEATPKTSPGPTLTDKKPYGFKHHLDDMAAGEVPDWASAVASFRTAFDAQEKARAERRAADAAARGLPGLRAACERAERDVGAARAIEERARTAAEDATATLAQANLAMEQARAQRLAHRQFKPGLLDALFTLGRAVRRWNATDGDLADRVSAAERAASAANHAANQAAQAVKQASAKLTDAYTRREQAQQRLAEAQHTVDDAVQRWGDAVPGAW